MVVSNDNLLSLTDEKYKKKDPSKFKKASYYVYDKDYKLIDTYTENLKGYNTREEAYPVYYAPLGMGDISYYVKRNIKDGSAVLYGGSKSQIGGLNGAQFDRQKLATIKQSPSAKYWSEKEGRVTKIW